MASTVVARNAEMESGWARGWRIWKYVWTVIKNLIVCGVILLVFEKFTSPFETVTLGILVLIYQDLNFGSTVFMRTYCEESFVQRGLFLGIFKKLGDDSIQEAEDDLQEMVKKYKKANVQWYINLVFSLIIWIFIVIKIVAAVL